MTDELRVRLLALPQEMLVKIIDEHRKALINTTHLSNELMTKVELWRELMVRNQLQLEENVSRLMDPEGHFASEPTGRPN